MISKPVLMIHEIKKKHLLANINWENYILTFDDCLYSQYYYWTFFRDIETTKILFVPCSLILHKCQRKQFDGEYVEFPTCEEALDKRFREPYNYISLPEIKRLIETTSDLVIGGHGYSHSRISHLSTTRKIIEFQKDIIDMIQWFKFYLNFSPTYYCYPFNYDDILTKNYILINNGIRYIYGKERIDIETLL